MMLYVCPWSELLESLLPLKCQHSQKVNGVYWSDNCRPRLLRPPNDSKALPKFASGSHVQPFFSVLAFVLAFGSVNYKV